jgi:hypothetical protein
VEVASTVITLIWSDLGKRGSCSVNCGAPLALTVQFMTCVARTSALVVTGYDSPSCACRFTLLLFRSP